MTHPTPTTWYEAIAMADTLVQAARADVNLDGIASVACRLAPFALPAEVVGMARACAVYRPDDPMADVAAADLALWLLASQPGHAVVLLHAADDEGNCALTIASDPVGSVPAGDDGPLDLVRAKRRLAGLAWYVVPAVGWHRRGAYRRTVAARATP